LNPTSERNASIDESSLELVGQAGLTVESLLSFSGIEGMVDFEAMKKDTPEIGGARWQTDPWLCQQGQ
jgi:hypothetical protein